MPATTSEKTVLHTSVDQDFAQRVREAAELEDRSISYLIRTALACEPDHHEQEAQAMTQRVLGR